MLSFDSMLPYSESGLATRIVVFPLKAPLQLLSQFERTSNFLCFRLLILCVPMIKRLNCLFLGAWRMAFLSLLGQAKLQTCSFGLCRYSLVGSAVVSGWCIEGLEAGSQQHLRIQINCPAHQRLPVRAARNGEPPAYPSNQMRVCMLICLCDEYCCFKFYVSSRLDMYVVLYIYIMIKDIRTYPESGPPLPHPMSL